MRRQLGAETVDLDTEAGIARYGVVKPRAVDLAEISEAVTSASYTLHSVDIELTGVVQQVRCETCAADVTQLLVDGTQQVLELEFGEQDPPVGMHLRLSASTPIPSSPHPRWEVLSWGQP